MSKPELYIDYLEILSDSGIYFNDLDKSISIILKKTAIALDVSRVSIWLLSEDKHQLNCLSLYISNSDQFESGATIGADLYPAYFKALLGSRFIDASDAATDPRTKELKDTYLDLLDVKSLLDGSIHDFRNKNSIRGVLCAEMIGVQRDWSSDERNFIAATADLISQQLLTDQLRQTEAKYKSLYEGSTDGIMIFNSSNSVFVDVNPAALKLFKASKEDIVGKSPFHLSPKYQPNGEPSEEQAIAHTQACLSGTPQHFEWRHTRIDGTEFDCEITLNTVLFAGKDTVFAHIRDITSKKIADRLALQNYQLEIANKEAEELAKSKTNFLANMSHEIRTPMNGIFGMVSLVLDTPLNPEQKDYIETIQSSTESLLTILNDVLEYSKLSNSEIKLDVREFSPRNLILDIVRTYQNNAVKKGITLQSTIEPTISESLLGDDHRIRQILSNLVDNAMKFTDQGSVNINVCPLIKEDSASWIRFSISDSGIGIDDSTQEMLFQPFTQADPSITRNYGGTGLGLAISRDLAIAMGGYISVESTVGTGSTFHLDLCLNKPEQGRSKIDEQDSSATTASLTELATQKACSSESILIVEDNLINQQVTSSILEKLGYTVAIANNGQEAVDLCKDNDYSIIFMDLSMPKMDGFEATQLIRRQQKDRPRATIIAVTGHAFIEHRQRCEEVGIDDFLSKPYNLFKLKEKLDYYSDMPLN